MLARQESALRGKVVLVTGGAGFIGSHLVEALLLQGARVRVLDSLSTGRLENLVAVANQVEFVQGDVRHLSVCQAACKGAAFVLHLAALGSVPRSLELPADTIDTNVSGTAALFTAARDQSVRRVVYASSSSVYGGSEELPKREGSEGFLLSPYALSKRMTEELAAVFVRIYSMQIVGLRFFNVYGPRQSQTGAYAAVIPQFIGACRAGRAPIIFGDGEQSRDFTYVSDVAEACLCALTQSGGEGLAFNVGAGKSITVNDVARVIMDVTGFSGKVEYRTARIGDIRHSVADSHRMLQTFGWCAKTSFEDGIRRCAEFYR